MGMEKISAFTWLVILACLITDFANGWNDCANAIATTVATRVLTPLQAIIYSALLNIIGAFISTKVAKMVGGNIVNPDFILGPKGQLVILAAMLAGTIWLFICTFLGLPISGSHSLMGGLAGSAVGLYSFEALKWGGIKKILIAMLVSPLLGMLAAFIFIKVMYFIARFLKPRTVNSLFSKTQIVTTGLLSLTHGQNDAQKIMGVITLLLWSQNYFGKATEFKNITIPWWVILAAGLFMGLGTAFGGWRVIKTLGMKLSHMKPIDASAAEMAGATVLFGIAQAGIPVSTTHTITGTIIGAGIGKRGKNIKWHIGQKILYAWILTLPAVFILGAIFSVLLSNIAK